VPEGDTVWLTAHRLDAALRGRIVTRFELRVPRLAVADLRGDAVAGVVARGKHILIRFVGGSTLHTHLRMDGSWHLSRADRRPNRHPVHMIRVLVGNEDWLAVGYRVHNVRMLATCDETAVVGHLGPDLLGPGWDPGQAAEAVDRLRQAPQRPVGEGLLDQRNMAGIGNLYRAEVLFLCRVNPWAPVRDVADLSRLVDTARRLLRANRDHPEQSTTGLTTRGDQHWVYLRGGQPCRRCGTLISAGKQGEPPRQRPIWWCARCQPS
jgi:endonuclease-8